MSLYRIYIDEVGNHDLTHADDPNQRFLSLTGVIIETGYSDSIFIPEFNRLKHDYFQKDPDEPIVFHRKELINKTPPFQILRNPEIEHKFNKDLLDGLERWDYKVITVVIDKKAHRDQYQQWHYHPYHYCLAALLERYVLFLNYSSNRGDVVVEKRGGKEDEKLLNSFERLWRFGTDKIPKEIWQKTLTSHEMKLHKKEANIAGLQLADIIAHPSRREVLLDHQLITDKRDVFGDQICRILQKGKYRRDDRAGRIDGFGKKLLP